MRSLFVVGTTGCAILQRRAGSSCLAGACWQRTSSTGGQPLSVELHSNLGAKLHPTGPRLAYVGATPPQTCSQEGACGEQGASFQQQNKPGKQTTGGRQGCFTHWKVILTKQERCPPGSHRAGLLRPGSCESSFWGTELLALYADCRSKATVLSDPMRQAAVPVARGTRAQLARKLSSPRLATKHSRPHPINPRMHPDASFPRISAGGPLLSSNSV